VLSEKVQKLVERESAQKGIFSGEDALLFYGGPGGHGPCCLRRCSAKIFVVNLDSRPFVLKSQIPDHATPFPFYPGIV
jgi:hypothetical protein